MPDRTQLQGIFLHAKCCLRLGQLDVGTPQFFGAPVGHVAAENVAAVAGARLLPGVVTTMPLQPRGAVGRGAHANVIKTRRALIALEQTADATFDDADLLWRALTR